MKNKGTYYITTAIAYTSGKPHIGNTYEIILADAIARFKRKEGYDVHFQTGSDEHGQKIETRAIEDGSTPKEFVDKTAGEIKRLWDMCNTTYDRFIRTTDEDHVHQVQKIFKKLYDKGEIYKGEYDGWYCTECESFYTDSQLTEDGKCPVCGNDVHREKEEAYFFRLSKYGPKLIDYINEHPEFIQPASRKNEMMNNFLKPGLQDLCVSRTSFKWGIPVDFDPGHVVYVWLDALTNYITGIGYDADGNSSDEYKKYWPADLHLIGKDIVRFHTIYWPAFLMALDEPLPKQVFGHPWLLQGGEKMSKSKGNVIYADDMIDLFGVDAVRYFCIHEMPYENDGVITWDLMTERYNSDLANTLGNLVSRTVSMTNKYFGGVVENKHVTSHDVPVTGASDDPEGADDDVIRTATETRDKCIKDMDTLHAADAVTDIFKIFKRLNKYVDETEPWILAKDPEKSDRLKTVLYNLTEGIVIGASLLYPFMPETAEKIAQELNTSLRDFDDLDQFGLYPDGNKVEEKLEILFARKDAKEIAQQTDAIMEKQKKDFAAQQAKAFENLKKAGKLTAANMAGDKKTGATTVSAAAAKIAGTDSEPAPITDMTHKEEITIDDFGRLEFRVGEIIECKAVEKSKKLLCSQVRIGNETKQIVSGIRKYYSPEEMVGKKVMVVCNLKPARLAGVKSEGMLLCAEDADGNLALMTPEKNMPSGAEIC